MNKKWLALVLSVAAFMAAPLVHAEEVARSIVTTAVVDREPVDDLNMIPTTNDTVYFFTDLRQMEGQTIVHRWMHEGEQLADVNFDVKGPRWRVWSSKKMLPEWTGSWTVQVVNGVGKVLAEKSFTYGEAAMEAPADEQAPAAKEAPMMEEAPKTEAAPATGEQGGTEKTE